MRRPLPIFGKRFLLQGRTRRGNSTGPWVDTARGDSDAQVRPRTQEKPFTGCQVRLFLAQPCERFAHGGPCGLLLGSQFLLLLIGVVGPLDLQSGRSLRLPPRINLFNGQSVAVRRWVGGVGG